MNNLWVDQLVKMRACDEAVDWCRGLGDVPFQRAWNCCLRGDWMLWLLAASRQDEDKITIALCDIIHSVLFVDNDFKFHFEKSGVLAVKWYLAGNLRLRPEVVEGFRDFVAAGVISLEMGERWYLSSAVKGVCDRALKKPGMPATGISVKVILAYTSMVYAKLHGRGSDADNYSNFCRMVSRVVRGLWPEAPGLNNYW